MSKDPKHAISFDPIVLAQYLMYTWRSIQKRLWLNLAASQAAIFQQPEGEPNRQQSKQPGES